MRESKTVLLQRFIAWHVQTVDARGGDNWDGRAACYEYADTAGPTALAEVATAVGENEEN